MHQIRSYLKFLLRSTNQHGVHSPFVFGLVTRCFYDRTEHAPAYQLIREHRKGLLQDDRSIEVKDLGAGSRVFSPGERKIRSMVKNAGITSKRARLLNRLVRYLDVKHALELGTSLGLGTAALAAGNQVQVTTIEGCPATAGIAAEQFRKSGLENIDLRVGEFSEVLQELLTEKDPHSLSLVYFDGNHQKEPTLEYFEKLVPLAHNDSVFIFDDIHWSPEMEQAWETIKADPRVTVTIDTYFWGLAFFRREQEKEHFVIRV